MISPHARRQQFSMLESASAADSASELDDEAVLPYRISSAGRPSSAASPVHLADSIGPPKLQHLTHGASPIRLLLARENLGLVAHYAALGVVHGLLQALAYPFLNVYLNVEDFLAYAAERWMAVPWLLKLFGSLASDCIPIRGSRRRAYMLAGWGWTVIFSLVLVVLPVETAYLFTNEDGATTINYEAPNAGKTYAALFTMVSFGFVFADVAADGATLELAWRFNYRQSLHHVAYATPNLTIELAPHSDANCTRVMMATVYAVRFAAQFVAMFFVALFCSSSEYGGTSGWGAPISGMMVLGLLASIAALVATWFFITEDKAPNTNKRPPSEHGDDDNDDASRFRVGGFFSEAVERLDACRRVVWRLFRRRAVLVAAAYAFVSRVCFTYYASTSKAIYEYWAPPALLTTSIFSSIHAAVFSVVSISIVLLLTRHSGDENGRFFQLMCGGNINWYGRRLAFMAVVGSAFITLVVSLFAVYNVLRYATVLLLLEQLGSFFDALAFLVVLFVATEIVEPGIESSSFNLVASLAGNLAAPFAISLSQSIGERFDIYDSEYAADSNHARSQVMLCVIVAIVIRLLNIAALPLLPSPNTLMRSHEDREHHERAADPVGMAAVDSPTVAKILGLEMSAAYGGSKTPERASTKGDAEVVEVPKWLSFVALGVTAFMLFWSLLMVLLASVERTSCLTVAGGESC